jgi:DNA invertase Pin-like site-specific DNA recombinase
MPDHPRQEPAWHPRTAVLGYASIGPALLEHSNGDLHQQARQIAAECKRRGLVLVEVVHDRVPPRQRPLDRPGLGYVLEQIAAKAASGLVVSELSQLSHALPDLGRVLEWLTRRDARVIAAAPGIDTAEDGGRLAIRTIIEVSRWEHQRLVERTRAGMRAARRKGPARVSDDPALQERIAGMRASGMTLQAIANRLNADGIPTLRGGAVWRPSSVQAAAGYRRPSTTRDAQLE